LNIQPKNILNYSFLKKNKLNKVINYINILEQIANLPASGNNSNTCIGIVFSKNRPLQLYSLLKSYFDNIINPPELNIVYYADDIFLDAYSELNYLYKNYPINFIRQNSFKQDIINIIKSTNSNYIFFLVDDIVFIDNINFSDISSYCSMKYIPSLRLGNNLSFCYMQNKEQPLPTFESQNETDLLIWNWKNGVLDWNYPLSVDGNIFLKNEMQLLLENINFQAPNSLEAELQLFKPLFTQRKGICYKTSRLLNIPCNKVQNENSNKAGNISAEELLDLWNKGLVIDTKALYQYKNKSVHEDFPLNFIKRNLQ